MKFHKGKRSTVFWAQQFWNFRN